MRKMAFFVLGTWGVLGVGCAADDASHAPEPPVTAARAEAAPVSLGAAFYGLTVMDCQTEATQCFDQNSRPGALRLDCTAQLSSCLADVSLQAASDVVSEAGDTVACGTGGLDCFRDAGSLQDVLACKRDVDSCVIDRVHAVTGLVLPAAGEILGGAVNVAGHTVQTAAGVIGHTVDAATDLVDHTVGTAVHVVGHTVDLAVDVAEGTLDAAGHVVGTAVGVVGDVVEAGTDVLGATLDAAGTVVGGVLKIPECSLQSQRCWRETRDFVGCQLQYAACLRK